MDNIEMVVISGVRYRREDAVKLGLIEPAAVARHKQPDPEEPEESADPEEPEESADTEEGEVGDDGTGPDGDADTGQPGGARRKAPRRAN